jgi:inorganic pyrophosphatase
MKTPYPPHPTPYSPHYQIPQTWENPNLRHPFVNEPGDADPIDFFDIGLDTGFPGQIKQSKVLGGLAPNDGGETDWKILTIDINDPLAPFVNNFEDLEKYRPGMLDDFYAWFTYYKVARGSDVISITGNAYQNASFIVEEVLPQGHKWWQDLIAGKEESELDIAQTSFSELGSYIAAEETYERFGVPATDNILPAAAKPSQYNSWYFLNDELELIQQGEN